MYYKYTEAQYLRACASEVSSGRVPFASSASSMQASDGAQILWQLPVKGIDDPCLRLLRPVNNVLIYHNRIPACIAEY